IPAGEKFQFLSRLSNEYNLHTVCEEAACPNIAECWGSGTATFMILGDTCTRACRFCNVKSGNPHGFVDYGEPFRVAEAVSKMDLKYIVITSVDRDDLPDGGASIFASTVKAIKAKNPDMIIELLIPDFKGDTKALETVAFSGAEVIGHNIETVRRLTGLVRDPRANYEQSLFVLRKLKEINPKIFTKSSIIVGFGESEDEVYETMKDLRNVNVDFLTIGQYLRPSRRHLPVVEFVHPEKFRRYREYGLKLGFRYVAAGPFVRSSYRAGEFFIRAIIEASKK
ncbi:MAG TPA: lipoyl synthase, partial [Geobacterales bacterium]|nr:lipoyl synthase [Geobacterales bacterium]